MIRLERCLNGGNPRIKIEHPYHLKEEVKALGSRWDPRGKFWHMPWTPRSVHSIMAKFPDVEFDLSSEVADLAKRSSSIDQVNIETHLPKAIFKPWDHQPVGVSMIGQLDGCILNWDVGAGKTKTVYDAILHYGFTRTLIVCPHKVVSKVWGRQCKMHLPRDYNLKVLPLDRQTIPKRALKIEEAALSGVPFMAVINFEVIWREPMLSTLSGITWDLVVVDESHRIARHSTKSGKALWNKIGPKSKHRVCLSGTVLSNGPVDAFGQTLFADPSLFGESFMRFRSRFCVMGGFEGKEILGYQNVDQFRETLGQITHRVRIDDILELPPMVDEQIQIDLPKKTMAVYETLKNEFVAELTDGTVVADNILVKLLRLQQITSGYCPTEDPETGRERIEVLDSEKIDAFTDKMKEIDPREPVVVFVRFVYDIENIMKACADIDRPCYRISGGYDEMEQWEEDSDLGLGPVVVVQIQSGGEGLDFTRAHYCFMYSIGFSRREYVQARGRIRRPGQKAGSCYFYQMVARGTVDQYVYAAIGKKQKVVDSVVEMLKHGSHDLGGSGAGG